LAFCQQRPVAVILARVKVLMVMSASLNFTPTDLVILTNFMRQPGDHLYWLILDMTADGPR